MEINLIKIFVKQFSGKTIVLDVPANIEIADLAIMTYNKRSEKQKDATMYNYMIAIKFVHNYKDLDFEKRISEYNIANHSTINEMPKSYTMSPDFNWNTLSLNDPTSLNDTNDIYTLNPGCIHAFDRSLLNNLIKKKMNENQKPTCPICRTDISPYHIFKLNEFNL